MVSYGHISGGYNRELKRESFRESFRES